MARSLNRVQLIGNLTRDPELRYTPSGTAVCSFGLATNRSWTTDTGEKHEEAEFHRIVSWNKLAELCSQFLTKGRKIYVEGRLATRNWTTQDGQQRSTTEVVIDDMILLDNKRVEEHAFEPPSAEEKEVSGSGSTKAKPDTSKAKKESSSRTKENREEKEEGESKTEEVTEEDIAPDDIPF